MSSQAGQRAKGQTARANRIMRKMIRSGIPKRLAKEAAFVQRVDRVTANQKRVLGDDYE